MPQAADEQTYGTVYTSGPLRLPHCGASCELSMQIHLTMCNLQLAPTSTALQYSASNHVPARASGA
jgi:hypothetical protein